MGPSQSYKKKNIRWFHHCKRECTKEKTAEENVMRELIIVALCNNDSEEKKNAN